MPSHGFYEYLCLQWIWKVICVFQSRTTLAHTVFLFLKQPCVHLMRVSSLCFYSEVIRYYTQWEARLYVCHPGSLDGHLWFVDMWSNLTPLPVLRCVAISKSQTFLWCGCCLLKHTGQASDNWNRMVSEQGFYTQTQHNGQGWTKTSNHLLNQATLSHYSTTQSLKYPHLYFSETAQHDEQGCIFF